VTGRRGKRGKQLPDFLKEKRGYCKLKNEALDRALWRTGFGRGCGPTVRQTAELMNDRSSASWRNDTQCSVHVSSYRRTELKIVSRIRSKSYVCGISSVCEDNM